MKTVDKCPNCGEPTTAADYYWHEHTETPAKKNPNCKNCVRKKERLRAQQKKEYAKMFI